MECNLCGSKATTKSEVDGVILDVCQNCAGSGKELGRVNVIQTKKPDAKMPELDIIMKEGFQNDIKSARQKKGLTQEQLANVLQIKSSVIRRAEEGWEPPASVVTKLEKFFKIQLTETMPEITANKADRKKLTIGDLVEIE